MVPKVSVLMSAYNGARYLRETAESILNQIFTDFEFIIVDDGSTDGTWSILAEYADRDQRVTLIRNKQNIGLTKSLNKGLRAARGEYIARQDADDVSLPERLAKQVAFLDQQRSVVLLGTAIEVISESGKSKGTSSPPCRDANIRWVLLLDNTFWHSSVMVRRSVLMDNNLWYDEELRYSQDYDLWSRVLMYGQGANLPDVLVQMRFHDHQISRVAWNAQQEGADRVAFANFERAGLADHFSRAEVALMRRPTASLAPAQRLARFQSMRKLFRIFDHNLMTAPPGLAIPEPAERRLKLRNMRLSLIHPPRDLVTLQSQWRLLKADPVGVLSDVSYVLRLFVRNKLRHYTYGDG
jgi:glycosyltransferase involved in cell wall biosynthesis